MKTKLQHSRLFGCICVLLSISLLQACSTSIKASSAQNPAPTEAFSGYGQIELKTVQFRTGLHGDAAGLEKIDLNLKKNLEEALTEWNMRPRNGRKLVIEPIIEELQFTHGAKRVLLGPLAGSSGVLIRLRISDENGKLIASPEFFQRADAMAAGFIFGVHDNMMLTRVAKLASNYLIANYSLAIGGETGADHHSLKTIDR